MSVACKDKQTMEDSWEIGGLWNPRLNGHNVVNTVRNLVLSGKTCFNCAVVVCQASCDETNIGSLLSNPELHGLGNPVQQQFCVSYERTTSQRSDEYWGLSLGFPHKPSSYHGIFYSQASTISTTTSNTRSWVHNLITSPPMTSQQSGMCHTSATPYWRHHIGVTQLDKPPKPPSSSSPNHQSLWSTTVTSPATSQPHQLHATSTRFPWKLQTCNRPLNTLDATF